MKLPNFTEKDFRPHYALKLCVVIAMLLSLFMALRSEFSRHPDEEFHFIATKYYFDHFIPPVIDDPAIRDSYSVFGVSYLNYQWLEYFVAGKISWLISFFTAQDYLAVRFSSLLLFASIIGWFLFVSRKQPEEFIIPCLLLIASQVWYIFSYSNNDAFVLFLSLLAAYQLASPDSLLNKFLGVESFTNRLSGGLWFGVLLGSILICKPNYYPFLIFAALWVLLKYGFFKTVLIKKYAAMFLIAIGILAFRCGLDIYVNGETNYVGASYVAKFFGQLEKKGKLLEYQEVVAEYPFRPSTLQNDPANSRPDLLLMAKGVSLNEMLFNMGWFELSFSSFAGGYGYMNVWASRKFYNQIAFVFLLFFGYLIFAFVRSRNRTALLEFGITALCCFLTLAISIALSWIYAFQPQGRYLFPILPMLGVLIYSNRRHLNNLVMNCLFLLLFLFAAYAFITVALVRINAPIILVNN